VFIFGLLALAAILVEWVWVYWLGYVIAVLAVLVAAKLIPGFVRGYREAR
jgi:hypothetical protein